MTSLDSQYLLIYQDEISVLFHEKQRALETIRLQCVKPCTELLDKRPLVLSSLSSKFPLGGSLPWLTGFFPDLV